jgi:hypothetical protein
MSSFIPPYPSPDVGFPEPTWAEAVRLVARALRRAPPRLARALPARLRALLAARRP